jgi:hypothetical protein
MAPIKDGRYDTRGEGGRLVSFGPQIVMIAGYDAPAPSSSQPRGVKLFKPHEQPVEITKDSSELNLVVPDSVPRLKPTAAEEF